MTDTDQQDDAQDQPAPKPHRSRKPKAAAPEATEATEPEPIIATITVHFDGTCDAKVGTLSVAAGVPLPAAFAEAKQSVAAEVRRLKFTSPF